MKNVHTFRHDFYVLSKAYIIILIFLVKKTFFETFLKNFGKKSGFFRKAYKICLL